MSHKYCNIGLFRLIIIASHIPQNALFILLSPESINWKNARKSQQFLSWKILRGSLFKKWPKQLKFGKKKKKCLNSLFAKLW